MPDSPTEPNATSVQPRLIILADDLTGALDSGVEFANVGLRVFAATTPHAIDEALVKQPEILVVNTASRECCGDEAKRIHERLHARFNDFVPTQIFKKVDSRLKGNICNEVNGLTGGDLSIDILCAPAIPDMGRLCEMGVLFGDGIDQSVNVRQHLSDVTAKLSVPDCLDQEDLARVVDSISGNTLLVGARGLARALAQTLATAPYRSRQSPHISRSLLAAIGSRDPITCRQIDSFLADAAISHTHLQAANGILPHRSASAGEQVLLQLTQGKLSEDRTVVSDRFVKLSAEFVKTKQYDNVLACGGETAQGLLMELGIKVLEVRGELFPGVPVSTAQFDSWSFSLITKSGGFGDADLLTNLFQLISLSDFQT